MADMDAREKLDRIDPSTRELLAKALVANDLTVAGIARYGRVHAAEAQVAMDLALSTGLIEEGATVDPAVRTRLVADLPLQQVAETHAAVARHLMAGGPAQLVAAVDHARAAGSLVPLDELVELADRGGRMSLSLNDYRSAFDLLTLAVEFDATGSNEVRGNRLCDLAAAADGLGRVDLARSYLVQAATLGELAGDPSLVSRAAVQHALPVDWFAGDMRSAALLHTADAMPLTKEERVMVTAARALVEIRIPVEPVDGQQLAWVTRPEVAHALADRALEESENCDMKTRGFVALAWRTVHRSPAFLSRRREMSGFALNVAQQFREPSSQVEAAVWLAVDALESGDRPLYDQALSVQRWVAERDGNPRIKWRAYQLAAGAAFLDGEVEAAAALRRQASEMAEAAQLPARLGGDLLMLGQEIIDRDDVDAMKWFVPAPDDPALISPLAKAVVAKFYARLDNPEIAGALITKALRQLDMESSFLLLATRCADAVLLSDDVDLTDRLITVLSGWHDHVAVDSNAWWCDGPVSLWLALLHAGKGEIETAREYLDEGEVVARDLNDVRSLKRAAELRRRIGSDVKGSPSQRLAHLRLVSADVLSDRETRVLSLLALGATNREIAAALSFSVGTIRADTMSIYRKLDVNGRVEAVARAISMGLVSPTP